MYKVYMGTFLPSLLVTIVVILLSARGIPASALCPDCKLCPNGTCKPCSNGTCKLLDDCESDGDCAVGMYCTSCPSSGFIGKRCIRTSTTNPFKLLNDSLPFNKYAFLMTHKSYAIKGSQRRTFIPRVTVNNQEDSVSEQLNNGVRALMLDTYDFKNDVWLCHSIEGKCHDFTAFKPVIDTLREIEAFLASNQNEIVTLILNDFVEKPTALTNVFNLAGLKKYWFPVANMPKNGGDWPTVRDMIAKNYRLLVFTTKMAKEQSEGIAYQWNYMVENNHGESGMQKGQCSNRIESAKLDDPTKSLVLVNYYLNIPDKVTSCRHNSADLINMLHTCYSAAGRRWANFVAVDYYKRSEGGGVFQALDTLNGKLLCECDDIHACMPSSTSGACTVAA